MVKRAETMALSEISCVQVLRGRLFIWRRMIISHI